MQLFFCGKSSGKTTPKWRHYFPPLFWLTTHSPSRQKASRSTPVLLFQTAYKVTSRWCYFAWQQWLDYDTKTKKNFPQKNNCILLRGFGVRQALNLGDFICSDSGQKCGIQMWATGHYFKKKIRIKQFRRKKSCSFWMHIFHKVMWFQVWNGELIWYTNSKEFRFQLFRDALFRSYSYICLTLEWGSPWLLEQQQFQSLHPQDLQWLLSYHHRLLLRWL